MFGMTIEEIEGNRYKAIENYKNLVNKKEAEIEELTTIKNSLTASLIRGVRSLTLPYMEDMMKEAANQQKLKKKSERPTYEWMKKRLIEELFDEKRRKDVKLESIVTCGYEGYAYGFTFDYNGTKFELYIPVPEKATEKNLQYMWYGQYELSYEHKSSVWHHIAKSYKLKDIAKALEEFIVKGENENENK